VILSIGKRPNGRPVSHVCHMNFRSFLKLTFLEIKQFAPHSMAQMEKQTQLKAIAGGPFGFYE
jgi:hypothetical protein